ncbi:uncharacterized protein MELLADRAFT_109487 [Melampsora larici-populina 98AG31]|uniref:Uncharacterized protein n=1 Tax=Melampsora larici-populina (strain 98AG31 / pathotype 3-4-7) TaxID=747676 RepID=F4RWM6_MELLP|nr:uncharacterized protein MELLADRAFT_109487 [Melampsora larici-populina 98AG31]EGG03206.1 hypothetical protein MELLADRAFT_109487 [Melampsora larici-populina 98AG31]
MSTQQGSTLAHVDIDSNPIFGTSTSQDLWKVNEVWLHRVIFGTGKEAYSLGLISRQPLILMQSKKIKLKAKNEDVSFVIKAAGKLALEDQKNIKLLDRFCRFLLHLDETRKSSEPDRFLIPIVKNKIDWKRVEDPFKGISMVRNGFTTLEKIYEQDEGSKLESMINRFALTKSFSTGFSNSNSRGNRISNIIPSDSGSKTKDQTFLPFEFWSISDRITSVILKIPRIEFKPDLQGLPFQIKEWEKIRKKSIRQGSTSQLNIQLKNIGDSFTKRVMSVKLFLSGKSVENLEYLRNQELMPENLCRLQNAFLECQFIERRYKKIPYLLGACYFYEANQHSAMVLGQNVGLSYMEILEEDDGLKSRESPQIKTDNDLTDAEKELEAKLKYKFNDINLLRNALSRKNLRENRRLKWLGEAILDDWTTYALKDVLVKSPRRRPLHALAYMHWNATLSTWARRWLQPIKGLVESKIFEVNKDGRALTKTQADLVLVLIAVMCIDCKGDFYPDSTLDVVIRGMFLEEVKNIKSEYGLQSFT